MPHQDLSVVDSSRTQSSLRQWMEGSSVGDSISLACTLCKCKGGGRSETGTLTKLTFESLLM